ncbi:MAG: hypothetical protein GY762_19750 [Proteobacteria bacterium]|nr:hypothetical protein [Pseudomonadota bacterium]
MAFVIDQDLCSQCGFCISSCPNDAILRVGSEVRVSVFCSDCGNCTKYCPTKAVAKGPEKVDFNNVRIDESLKKQLHLKNNIVAMKYVGKPPENVTYEEGPQFWCAMCGDVHRGEAEESLFFDAESSICGGASMIGLGARQVPKQDYFDAMEGAQVIGEGNNYESFSIMSKSRNQYPSYVKTRRGVIIGSLKDVTMPDLILFTVNAHQLGMVSTATGFDTGRAIQGFAGGAGCIAGIANVVVNNKPTFTCGDHGARNFMQLDDDQLYMCFPYSLVPGLVKNLDRTVYAREEREGPTPLYG